MQNVIIKIVVLGLVLCLAKEGVSGRMWGDHGVLVATNMYLVQPALCLIDEMGMAAAFSCFDEDGVYRAAVQGVDLDGLLLFEDGPLFISSSEKWLLDLWNGVIAEPDNEGGVFVIWQVFTEFEDQYDVYAQHLDSNLRPTWDEGGVLLYRTNSKINMTSHKNYYGVLVSDEGGLIVVDRWEVVEERRGYNYLFFVRKFDADGTPTEDWPEDGEPLFEMNSDAQFYQDPGRGLWCFGRDARDRATLLINLIQPDGTKRYEEDIQPELPEHGVVDNFTPDHTGGFYLALWELGGGNFCNAGIQRYDEEGRPVWDERDIWFFHVERSHRDLIPIASENGSRLFCFVYDEPGEVNSIINTDLYWIAPEEESPRLLWNNPMWFQHSQVEPFFFMGEGELLLNVMLEDWNEERENWRIERAEANIISPGGRLLWDEGTAPIEPHGKAVSIDWESFYVTTEIITPDRTNHLRIDYLNLMAEREWEEEVQVYQMSQFGELVTTQQTPDGSVRLISGHWMNHTSHETMLHYQILDPDGSLRLPIQGQDFFEIIDKEESSTSNGAYIIARYEGGPGSEVYSDVSVFDDQGIVHPEEPLSIPDMNPDGELKKVCGDSVGGGFLVFSNGEDEERRLEILRVNRNCEWDGEILRPFDEPVSSYPEIIPDGSGVVWVTARTSERDHLIQKISAENELIWDEPVRWQNPHIGSLWRPIWTSTSDSLLAVVHYNRKEDLDSSNVYIWFFDPDGAPRWDEPVLALAPTTGFEHPHLKYRMVASSGGGIWLLVWESFNTPPEARSMKLQLISSEGERLLGDEGITLPDLSRPGGNSIRPQLMDDGEGGAWIFTLALDLEPEELRALHFNRDGELIDDREQPDPNGTAVITQFADGMRTDYIFPPWRYENGDVGVAFWYGYSARAQRISDRPNDALQRESAPLESFEITSVYPSPSNDRITVNYKLNMTGKIDLTLLDMTGRQVGLFYSGIQTTGEHQASIATGGLASGAYVIQLRAMGQTRQRLIVEVK